MDFAANMMNGGEWSSFNGGCEMEEVDFMTQFFPNCLLPNEGDGSFGLDAPARWIGPESMTAGVDGSSFYSSETSNSESIRFYKENSYSDSFSAPYPTLLHENYCLNDPSHILAADGSTMPFDFFTLNAKGANADQAFPDPRMVEEDCFNQGASDGYLEGSSTYLTEAEIADKHLQLKNNSQTFDLDLAVEDRISDSSNGSKKRPRTANEGKRNQKSRKSRKTVSCDKNKEVDVDAPLNRASSGSCSSEDDANECQGMSGGATSSLSAQEKKVNGKKRASQGSATDPQSLYARKRRERINERLRILQNLVPNGTKVDISTMLEEAVQYVKFLQHQIKMLSSDDMWMYAAIAYNGMHLGSDLNKLNAPAN